MIIPQPKPKPVKQADDVQRFEGILRLARQSEPPQAVDSEIQSDALQVEEPEAPNPKPKKKKQKTLFSFFQKKKNLYLLNL